MNSNNPSLKTLSIIHLALCSGVFIFGFIMFSKTKSTEIILNDSTDVFRYIILLFYCFLEWSLFFFVDGFKIGYMINKGKTTWFLQLEKYGSDNTIFIENLEMVEKAFEEAKNKIDELKK